MNYTFFDIETANRKNDSICSIAIIETDGAEILRTYSSLVNPETYFDSRNSKIHGITSDRVQDEPTLKQLWNDIEPYFQDHIVCGHNILFDIRVMEKHLDMYAITLPAFQYICTMKMAQSVSEFDSYKLIDLCQKFNIPITNHNALSDAIASFELYKVLTKQYNCCASASDIPVPNKTVSGFKRTYSERTVKMQAFKGFVSGILADGTLGMEEIYGLKEISEYLLDEEKDNFYFMKIYELIEQIYEDGEITKYEVEDLQNLLEEFLDPIGHNTSCANAITFEGSLFCLSGNFNHGSKADIEKIITDRGGSCKGSIVKTTNYLVVGGLGSQEWSMGNFGTKVEKALSMQEKGSEIKIISEEEFIKAIS